MESIKQSLPDEQSLLTRLDDFWDGLSIELHNNTKNERAEMAKYRNPMIAFWVLAGALFLVVWFVRSELITVVTAIIMTLFASYNTYHWYKAAEEYSKKLNILMYKLVFRFFELKGDYFGDDGEVAEANADAKIASLLKQSELLTEDTDTTKVGDVFKAAYEGNELLVGELDVTRTEGSGKNRRVVQVFKGLFAEYKLSKTLSGITFISTEGDETGYGHRNFWGRVTGKSKVEETELEWNEFEKDLHVATTDGTEARYILTPDLMNDLHDWWKIKERNIRMVFKGNKLYMLFPDKKIRVTGVVGASGFVDLKSYAMSIIAPIWHVLLLLEDIDKRFS